ncbi:hypothetical protein BJY00DRAFT_310596 [Aspergillus carlsbadensis]|nr:hypothetical protein BJY00DRAFT_310596 [Aspergillus carlsbadensis]
MAAARGGINFVRYFFYRGDTISPERRRALVALAYATARDRQLAPKKILIRSDIHENTIKNGQYVKDPGGWHGTFAFKDSDQVDRSFHVASHGYTNGREDFALAKATHDPEKSDQTPRGVRRSQNNKSDGGKEPEKVVWPEERFLVEYVDSPIGHCHLPEDK